MSSIEGYLLNHIDEEGELLSQLNRRAHVRLLNPRMLSGHLQGKVLKMCCRMLSPHRVLEIGTYTGYTTLCLAEALPEGGEIHTIEIDDELEDFILQQFHQSEHRDQIHLHIGDAMQVIPRLDQVFDLVFIDADKRMYCDYYDLIFDIIRPGGFIIADNTLWNGKVLEPARLSDLQTAGIQAFNDKVAADSRVEKVILPFRDGLTLIYKK